MAPSSQEFKALNGADPGTYSDTAYDAANILLAGIKAGKTTRESLLEFVKGYSGEGVAAQLQVRRGRRAGPGAGQGLGLQGRTGGKVVPDQEIPKS